MSAPARAHAEDRGLLAVRRVREVREQDSRIGLQHALAESRRKAEHAARLRAEVAAAEGFDAGSAASFRGHLQHLGLLARASLRADEAAVSGVHVAEEATRRWQHDRAEVRVVELLLERRAADRAVERARREAAELDDLAAAGWLRRRTAEARADARTVPHTDQPESTR